MAKSKFLFGLIILGVLSLTAIGFLVLIRNLETKPAAGKTTEAGKPGQVDPDEVDRLRSLGYIGFVPEEKDKGGSGVVIRKPSSYPGDNFYTNAGLCSAVLMDESGAIRNFWQLPPECYRLANAELLDTGDILAVGTDKGPYEDPEDLSARRFLLKMSWKGDLLWKRSIPAHHDVEVAPSGQLLAILIEHRRLPEVSADLPVRDNSIALLSPDGRIQESYSLYDLFHASPTLVSIQHVKGEKEVDLLHANSIEWMRPNEGTNSDPRYALSNILFCSRHQDTVGIIDWKTKRLVWAWGQGILSGPHDATMLPSGHILVFDNGLSRGWSRVIEMDPVARKIVWEYRAKDFFTAARGSSQRLPNGNTLISESDSGRAFEVTQKGEIVWEFRNPFRRKKGDRATIVRVNRVEKSEIDKIVLRLGEGRHEAPLTRTDDSDIQPSETAE